MPCFGTSSILKQNHYAKTKRTSSFNLNGSSSYKCIKTIEQIVEIYCTIELNKKTWCSYLNYCKLIVKTLHKASHWI